MKGSRKFRSFTSRLTRRLVLTLLLVMGIASFLVFVLGGTFVNESECLRHEAMLQTLAENISRVVSDVYVGTRNTVPQVEESLDNPDRLQKLVERVLDQNPRIHSCAIFFTENYYPQKGRCYLPYAVRRDSSHVDVGNIAAKRQGYLQEDWFLQGLKSEEGFWREPFFEDNDTIFPLVSYLHPIRDKRGRTVAVLSSDLSLDWLQEKMNNKDWEIYASEWVGQKRSKDTEKQSHLWKPYSFLISPKGTFLVHPDKRRIVRDNYSSIAKASSDTLVASLGRKMMAGKKGYFGMEEGITPEVEFDGQDSYIFFAPIKHARWSLVLVVRQMSIDLIAWVVGGLLAFLLFVAILVVWLACRISVRRAAKPLKQLAVSADEVAKGNFITSLPDIKHNDEIRLLRNSFEEMQHSLVNYIEELKVTTSSKAAIENELKIAHDIQMAMLPKTFPAYPNRHDIDIYGALTPAKAVGGDLFDFYIRDERLFFCIGDVSGKGVPASLVMAVARSLFRNVSSHVMEPETIVAALNNSMAEGNESNMFVTLFVGVLDLATGRMSYSNAGHEQPLLMTKEGCKALPCDSNLPVGVMLDWTFTRQEVTLEPGNTVFLYTDGLSEAENVNQEQFQIERVIQVANKLTAEGKTQSETIVNQVEEAVHAFVGDAEQSDDLTMLAIHYIP